MSDRARQLLTQGVAAAKANDKEEAKFYLEWVLRTDSTRAQKIRAWEYLAQITDDPKKKRDYLEDLIIHEPGNVAARRGLAMLNGDLKAEEVIDATHRPADAKTPPPAQPDMQLSSYGPEQVKGEAAQSKRYVCQQCGGTMAFSPDGQSLTCNYCDRQISLYQAVEEGAMVQERDFSVALATAKGHTHPVTMQSFSCQGCGAHFVLGPAIHSITCPYCSSAYVIQKRQTHRLIPPEGVIPFAFNQKKARQFLYQWLKKKKLLDDCQTSSPLGLYLPVWTFDIGGQVVAHVRGYRQGSGVKMPSQTIERPVLYNDIPVSASHRLPANLAEEIYNYKLNKVLPYNPGYLANWPAATYQISAAAASLVARKRVWKNAQRVVGAQIKDQVVSPFDSSSNIDITLNSSKLYVEAFKLIFLPLWLIRYRYQDKIYDTVVNGQNGHVRGETPSGKLKGWLRRIFKDEG
jgi:DNA-directed RNA polymerase subunit RPC12/RpoP